MKVYIINLFIVTIMSFLAMTIVKDKYNNKIIYNCFFLLLVIISLVCVSGFRYNVGTDYYTYTDIFTYVAKDSITLKESEVGFDIFMKLLYRINSNPQFFFFVTSAIINIGIVYFIKKYTTNLCLSMYFYITTFIYYGTMNGIRQYIASVIILLGFKHIINASFNKYIIYIIIAATFHTSALIMIPVYFLARGNIFSIGNKILVGIIAFAFIFYRQFLNILFEVLGNSTYSHYETIITTSDNGANILRILVWVIPVLIIIIFRKRAEEVYGKNINIIINMCIYGMLFMILAYRHVYFARLCMYFDVFYLVIIPVICKMFDTKTNRVVTYMVMVLYFLYSTLLLLRGESEVYPYKYNIDVF